jgi:hypothetical protein
MRQLVSSLRLAPAVAAAAGLRPDREQLVPDDTLNPALQRFYWFMGQRALNPQHQVGSAVQPKHWILRLLSTMLTWMLRRSLRRMLAVLVVLLLMGFMLSELRTVDGSGICAVVVAAGA